MGRIRKQNIATDVLSKKRPFRQDKVVRRDLRKRHVKGEKEGPPPDLLRE